MAKPTTYATPICIALTLFALLGIIIGLNLHLPIIVIIGLLPAVLYEIYRTEGESTRWASWATLIVLVLELIFIIFGLSYDLSKLMGQQEIYMAGSFVPLGDIKVVGPVVLAVLAVILFVRTAGVYTKWLSVIIFVTAFFAIYALSPTMLGDLIRSSVRQIFFYL